MRYVLLLSVMTMALGCNKKIEEASAPSHETRMLADSPRPAVAALPPTAHS